MRGNSTKNGAARRAAMPLSCLLLAWGPVAYGQQRVPLDPAAQYQVTDGWGCSLCWFGHGVGGWEDAKRTRIADLLFDPDKGLGLNIVRYNIGGGDAPGHKHMRAAGAVPGYRPTRDGPYDWTADANQRWMLQAAIQRGANITEAFANSPPWSMTVSGCSSGSKDGRSDNLRKDAYDDFADYLATVVKHFQTEWNITFDTIDPMNEPNAQWWKAHGRQEGCHFERESQERILRALAAALRAKGVRATRISAMDSNWVDAASRTFEAYDKATRSVVARINTHTYGGELRAEVRNTAQRYGKGLYMSEFDMGSNQDGHDHASMAPALDLASRIVLDLRDMQPQAWVLWQPVENEQYCLWWKYNYGLIHGDMMYGKQTFDLTRKYYAMMQFTKFIRPGFRMIGIGCDDAVAFVHGAKRRLVIVSVNAADAARRRRYDLSQFTAVGPSATPHRTADAEDCKPLAKLTASRAGFIAVEAPRSITTYVMDGVSYRGPVKINDTQQAPGPNRFEYVGQWSFTGREAGAFTRDNHWGGKKDDYYLVRFRGRQVKLYAARAPNYGIAAVSLDGGAEKRIDLYAPQRRDQSPLYSSPRLPLGDHILKVRVTGEKNVRSTDPVISADRADVLLD